LLTAASVEITAVDPEHPDARYCLAEWPIGAEEVVVERSDPLGDRPVEAPDLLDLRHSLTLVR